MCGIVGYTGYEQAAPLLIDGLSKLEYRGYDSAGLAIEEKEKIEVVRAKGRLRVLEEMTDNGKALHGFCGIGHTRWATHGVPSVVNAHPHCNAKKTIAVVHNGIIENYQSLKEYLEKKGYQFESETDTEVIAHLLDRYYKGDPLEAITKVMARVTGSYALGILFQDHPGKVFAVRKDSPMIVGSAPEGNFIASDIPAILKYTKNVYFVNNMEIVCMDADSIHFYNVDQEEIEKEMTTISWDAEAAEKGGYEHFMLKEIYEQPKAVQGYHFSKNQRWGNCIRRIGYVGGRDQTDPPYLYDRLWICVPCMYVRAICVGISHKNPGGSGSGIGISI